MSFELRVSELIMILRSFRCENEKNHKALVRLWVILLDQHDFIKVSNYEREMIYYSLEVKLTMCDGDLI